MPPLHLILPAGISFHTFQSLSYTIDVYRKQLRATRSPIQFATFVLFFPQLVAGPIVRAQDLLPQLAELPTLELEKATRGLFRIVVGLFKKIALADTLALVIVDRVFDAPEHFSSVEVLAGVYGYALQIYLDFSAYSDIAIGSAAGARLRSAGELSHAVSQREPPGVLAPLAHLAVDLAARLPLHHARRQPRRAVAHVREPRR